MFHNTCFEYIKQTSFSAKEYEGRSAPRSTGALLWALWYDRSGKNWDLHRPAVQGVGQEFTGPVAMEPLMVTE